MSTHPGMQPGRIGTLELRNRIIKTATFEGMTPGGVPSPALTKHHVEIAAGGAGMTTVAYCAVSPNGRTFADQLHMRAEILPALRTLTDAVHAEGAAVSVQLGHCGGFSKNRQMPRRGPLGPSDGWNLYGIASGRPRTYGMRRDELAQTAEDFATATVRAREAGFDAVELHLGHGYLLSQFLSPKLNRRRDEYGGSLENRMRFPLEVVQAVRDAVGPDYPLLAKLNLDDGVDGGLTVDESAEVARALEREGLDGIVLSGGLVSKSAFFLLRGGRPLRAMIEVEKNLLQKAAMAALGPMLVKPFPFEELFFLPLAQHVRAAVDLPLVLLGGVVSADGLREAMSEGFDFVAMGRALIADPDLPRRWAAGSNARSRCNHCNLCMTEMDRDHGVRCVLEAEVERNGSAPNQN